MKRSILIGTVVLAIGGAAVAQQTTPQTPPQKPAAEKPAAARGSADQQFVINVAKDGMAEVELGKLAAEKASKDDVKKFAQRMVDDHSKANDELKTLAQNKNITLPTAIDAKHKTHLDSMSKLSGEAFDRAYAKDMLADHQKAVAAFRTESKSGKDADVKAWAAKTLPTLEEHLKQAQELNRGVVGTSGTKKPQ
jgi:putative membrane protein